MQRLLQITSHTVPPEPLHPETLHSETLNPAADPSAPFSPDDRIHSTATPPVSPNAALNAAPPTIDARPRSTSASGPPPVSGLAQATDSISAAPQSGTADSISAELPGNLWMLLGLLGLGSLGLGLFNALVYPQGLELGAWLFLLITLVLQSFSTATSNRALQKLQGAIFSAALICGAIFSSNGFARGYFAGLLMGLGVGNILRLQWIHTQKRLPQNLSGLWELISDRTGTIALVTSVICFALPLLLKTHPNPP